MSNYDIAVAYRICPRLAKSSLGLTSSDDKLSVAEVCLHSFKESLGGLRVKLWVLLDGCPEVYADLFKRYFDEQDLVLVRLPGIGNQATFAKQIEILLGQVDSEVLYFAEDDYLYLPSQFSRMVDFLNAYDDVHFISPYDHRDCYTLEIHRHPKWIRVHAGHHWRTAASTCLTFLTRKKTLVRTQPIFQSYCQRNSDCSLWLSLTKRSVFNPLQVLRLAQQQSTFAKIILKAWLHGWTQILFGTRMYLWVPIPGIATHLAGNLLSPNVDWSLVIKQQEDQIALQQSGPAPGTPTRDSNAPSLLSAHSRSLG